MKHLYTTLLCFVIVGLLFFPDIANAQTRTVFANSGKTLDEEIMGDTTAGGARSFTSYQLVSTDTTYLFSATITVNTDFSVVGVPNGTTGELPCIQPDVLPDNSVPGVLFTMTGKGTKGVFKNLYLLGIAINNTVNYGGGQAIQISADSIRLSVDKVVFEQWSQFAIGYSGSWDKFFITNCKFRNMTTLPNQWYVGEVLRNENYLGAFKTDSIVMKYNTMLCVSGYATAATGGIVKYYEFSHNNVIYTFKNVFFLDRMVNAKFNDNIFYGAYAGGQNKTEFNGGWDSFTAGTVASIITMGPLDSTTASDLLGHPSTGAGDPAAEALRSIEVKNNVYYWPQSLRDYWSAWNDTAHVDSIYTPVWMNQQSIDMFANNTNWPGLVESGNQNVDPGFGASIPGVLTQATNGLLDWFRAVRTGAGTTEWYGYSRTDVAAAADWTPPWPLPEAADMAYSNNSLKTGATDGRPIGDPFWFTGPTGVARFDDAMPSAFALLPAYPNPFNPGTNLAYTLTSRGSVRLAVYNVLGQVVATLVNDVVQEAGSYTASVDLKGMSSGLYLAVLEQGDHRQVRRLVLMK